MAIAEFTYERFIKRLKLKYDYTILYNDKKYNTGHRHVGYYFLDWETLDFKLYYTVKELLKYNLIGNKSIISCWNDVVILRESVYFSYHEEAKVIKEYARRLEG